MVSEATKHKVQHALKIAKQVGEGFAKTAEAMYPEYAGKHKKKKTSFLDW